MEKLQLFNVTDEYIDFLKQTDETVCHNKNESRPYIGPLFKYKGMNFYAPLSSVGATNVQHNGHPNHDNFIHYKIIGHNKNTIGVIRFNNMIPVPDLALKKINISALPQSSKDLLNDDMDFIRTHTNTITSRGLSLFKMKSSTVRNNQGTKKYTKMCCQFKQLVVKANHYIQNKQDFVADINLSTNTSNSESASNLLAPVKPVQKVHMNTNTISSNAEDKFLDIGDFAIKHKPEPQQQQSEIQHTKLNVKTSSFRGPHM